MDRRHFLSAMAALGAGLVIPAPATAELQCIDDSWMGTRTCTVGIRSSLIHIAAASETQHQSQWCWAACIAMVFRYYGHAVSQERIVLEAFGAIADMPAYPNHILAALNRQWIDDAGSGFHAQADSWSTNVVTAATDLADDMPLIVGAFNHACLLTSMTYTGNQMDVVLNEAIVRDPWPGRGCRSLSLYEWNSIAFAARIRVI